jgi:Peptidase family M1 domain
MRAGVALIGLCWLVVPAMASPADKSPREVYAALNALRVDPASTFQIEGADRIELRRADMLLSFEQGKLAFLASLDGRTTGVVFSGRGHVLAIPRGVVEKKQMARFLGAPVLDQVFTSAALRFTDATEEELRHQLVSAKRTPQEDDDFAARWNSIVAAQNPVQSLRILLDTLTQDPRPYFYAAIEGIATGAFDLVVDSERYESVLLGQARRSGDRTYYDVWASYQSPGVSPRPRGFHALQYKIETSILADNSLEGKTQIRFRTVNAGERLLVFELARSLNVDGVTGESGQPLTYFQNEGISLQERSTHGDDYLYVVLPSALAPGAEFVLHFHYRGNVIQNAGNGVLFVSARESWYPHFGNAADFADYDLTMRWPRRLRLVATGAKTEEREDGEFRVGHWQTEKPVSVAGFNLGEYVSTSLASETHSVDVYANRQLEQALDSRLEGPAVEPPLLSSTRGPEGRTGTPNMMRLEPPAPRPADALKQLGREIDSSIRFYETLSGPFPYQKLSVSQIPGSFGQGWPGLLYLSTYSFLSAEAQQRAGLSANVQEHFTELVPFHEVAHQWWGNVVGWDSYRDQWINEAIANYLALLFADTRRGSDHSLRVWLDRYRQHLAGKPPNADQPNSDIGALDLGNRLSSSRSPAGFEEIIYSKGSWVMHMLRQMLRQPGANNPDARFTALLHTLATKYAYRGLSTADLQREVEAVMTPAMDLEGGRSMEWFFEQWVRGTGIPHYRVEFNVHHGDKGYLVKGKLFQEGVPRSFIASVPLFAGGVGAHVTPLGVVIAAGPETSFHFTAQTEPHKIVIDPQMTLLCVTQ